jgi:hypothetical protein
MNDIIKKYLENKQQHLEELIKIKTERVEIAKQLQILEGVNRNSMITTISNEVIRLETQLHHIQNLECQDYTNIKLGNLI